MRAARQQGNGEECEETSLSHAFECMARAGSESSGSLEREP